MTSPGNTWAADSREPGYLGPSPTETLLQVDWENFLQTTVAGIIGLPGYLVRPRWQPNPPPTPDVTVDWAACGITRVTANFEPAIQHYGDATGGLAGYDRVRRQEQVTYRVSCYGPHAGDNIFILRDGLYVEQNRPFWRRNAVGLVEAERVEHVPDLFRQQWRDRYDLEILINREVRRVYLVRDLTRSIGTISGDGSGHVVTVGWDTGPPPPTTPPPPRETSWDDGLTIWDGGTTLWDQT